MRIAKQLLLGGAAGLFAVGGAQAADLPVKAKPVEYVKVCSLYGEGFFYIPGTDTCLKIGGWVRYDMYLGNTGGSSSPYYSSSTGRNDTFDSADYQSRARTVVSFDARTQTEYGTLRAYYRNGFELTTNFVSQGAFYAERAFIQFGGFVLGKTQSFFDFSSASWSYANSYLGAGPATSGQGRLVSAYQATLGAGVTATLSLEDATSRRGALWDAGTNGMALGSFPGPNAWGGTGYPTCGFGSVTSDNNLGNTAAPFSIASSCATGDYAAQQVPDIVGSLRVDQTWGSAQIAAALHQVRGNFYGNDTQATISVGPASWTGIRPDDKWGWAVLGGIVLNLPWAKGDKFWIEGVYGQGTPCEVGFCQDQFFGTYLRFNGNTVASGIALDGVFANALAPAAVGNANFAGATSAFSGILLPTDWDIAVAVEHYWAPNLRTSLFGSFTKWDTGGPGSAMNNVMCASPNGPVRTTAGTAPNYGTGPLPGCDYTFDIWGVGSRTIWNPVKNLDVGFEVMYSKLEQNMDPTQVLLNFGGGGNRSAGLYVPRDQDLWSGIVRIQRNFYP